MFKDFSKYRKGKEFTKADQEKMFQLFKEGKSTSEIVERFPHKTYASVTNKLTRMGLTRG